jgi:serine/threonine protein phosphatase PrpC
MGGHEFGTEASQAIINGIASYFDGLLTSTLLDYKTLVTAMLEDVSRFWKLINEAEGRDNITALLCYIT